MQGFGEDPVNFFLIIPDAAVSWPPPTAPLIGNTDHEQSYPAGRKALTLVNERNDPGFSKKLQEFLQPRTCTAAFILKGSYWVKTAGVIGTVAAMASRECALCCITTRKYKFS